MQYLQEDRNCCLCGRLQKDVLAGAKVYSRTVSNFSVAVGFQPIDMCITYCTINIESSYSMKLLQP
jgi:hypothetical protein